METIRIPASDPRIFLSRNAYTPVDGQGMQGRSGAVMNVIFRGINVRVLGYPPLATGSNETMRFTMMDTDERKQVSSSTLSGSSQAPVSLVSYSGLDDSDHELEASMSSGFTIAFIEIDYLASSGYTPSISGSNATTVDPRAIIVNSGRPEIEYRGNQWTIQNDDAMLERDMYNCREPGRCSWIYSFEGSAIWWFTSLTDEGAVVSVTVDGVAEPEKVSLTGQPLHQRLVWSKTSLPFGRHTVVASLDTESEDSAPISLDFLRVLTEDPSSSIPLDETNSFDITGPSTIPSAIPSKTPQPRTIPVGAIAGAVIGAVSLILISAIIVLCCIRRRRRARQAEVDHSKIAAERIEAFPRLLINAEAGFAPQTNLFRPEKMTIANSNSASSGPAVTIGRSTTGSSHTLTTPQSPPESHIGLGLIPGPRALPPTPWVQSNSLSHYTETPPPRYDQI